MVRRVLCLALVLAVVVAAVAVSASEGKPKKAKGPAKPDGKPFKPEMYKRSRSRYPTVFAPYVKPKPIPGSHVPEIPEEPCQCAHPLPSGDVQRCRKWVKAEAYICDGADGKCRQAPVKFTCPCVHASLKRVCLHYAPPGTKVVGGMSDSQRGPFRNWQPPSNSRRETFEPIYHNGVPEHRHKPNSRIRTYDRANYAARRAAWSAQKRATWLAQRRAALAASRRARAAAAASGVAWIPAVPSSSRARRFPGEHILPPLPPQLKPLPQWVPPPKLQRYQRSVYPKLGALAAQYPDFDFSIDRDDLDFLLDRDDDDDLDLEEDLDFDADIDADAFDNFDDFGDYFPEEDDAAAAELLNNSPPTADDTNAVHRTGVVSQQQQQQQQPSAPTTAAASAAAARAAAVKQIAAAAVARQVQQQQQSLQQQLQRLNQQRKQQRKLAQKIKKAQKKAQRRRERLYGRHDDDSVHLPLSFPVSRTFEVVPATPRADAKNPNRIRLQPHGGDIARPMPGVSEQDIDIMTRTLWGEARGEEETGQRAIAWTLLNRVGEDNHGHRRFPNTLRGVCQQKNQFSIWNQKDVNHTRMQQLSKTDPVYQKLRAIAAGVVNGILADTTFGSKFYYATTIVKPKWAKEMNCSVKIGRHYFCRDHD